MVDNGNVRSHGQTTAVAEAKEQGKELDKIIGQELPDQPLLLTRAFQRLRTDWKSPDRDIIRQVMAEVENQIFDNFSEAHGILWRIYDIVRTPEVDHLTAEVKTDPNGLSIWKRNPDGSYIEDWSKITSSDREKLQYEIITKMFSWEQRRADIWGEALFAKAYWEESFATGFDTAAVTGKETVEARSAKANRVAADARYLAVYKSMYSKKADAVISSMERISQRLKDLST